MSRGKNATFERESLDQHREKIQEAKAKVEEDDLLVEPVPQQKRVTSPETLGIRTGGQKKTRCPVA